MYYTCTRFVWCQALHCYRLHCQWRRDVISCCSVQSLLMRSGRQIMLTVQEAGLLVDVMSSTERLKWNSQWRRIVRASQTLTQTAPVCFETCVLHVRGLFMSLFVCYRTTTCLIDVVTSSAAVLSSLYWCVATPATRLRASSIVTSHRATEHLERQ